MMDCPVQAEVVLQQVASALPATRFRGAKLLEGPCLVELTLANGSVAYADRSGRYFLIGALLDLKTGDGVGGVTIGDANHE
jgi:hypothetical protein